MTVRRFRRRASRPTVPGWASRHHDTILCILTYLLVVGGFVRLLAAPRLLSALLFLAFMMFAALYLHGRRARPPILLWLVALATTFLPVDVSFYNAPGPPHLVPLVMGYPSPEMWRAAARGEILLGGCLVFGVGPKWVVVW